MDITHAVPIETDLEAELVSAYPLLVRRLTLVLRDGEEAQDVAQAAFARALERRRLFRGGDARGWLYTIGLRLAFNELRRRRPLVALSDGGEPTWAMQSEPDLWAGAGTARPPAPCGTRAEHSGWLHARGDRETLGVRTGTVSSWLSRSKERLRGLLGDDR